MNISNIGIPKKLGHIWIGNIKPPTKWMDSWKMHHADWDYTLYDNKFLDNFDFQTRPQIQEYIARGQLAGAADLIRLEVLHKFGGLLPGADSICLRNTNELFTKKCIYTVYENEFSRGKLVSPIQASPPHDSFIKTLIDVLSDTDPAKLDDPWISTGNLFTAIMISKHNPNIVIYPSHYFIPIHFTGLRYEGPGPVYAQQMFGSTRDAYGTQNGISQIVRYALSIKKRAYRIRRLAGAKKHKNGLFDSETNYSQ